MRTNHPERFPASCRLKKRREFLALQRSGRRYAAQHFVLLCGVPVRSGWRLGITVSSRVGGAVVRNRIKRRVKEIFRRELRAALHADVVIIARIGAGELKQGGLAEELRNLCTRAARDAGSC